MTDQTDAESTTTSTDVATTDSALVTQYGKTSIADSVVAKIAGVATRDVSGVYALGGGAARAMGAIRERFPGSRTNHSQGVTVEVGERQAAIDLELVAEYGVAIADLAEAIRRNVISSVERMTALEVTEVNIAVADVHLETESESDNEPQEPAPGPVIEESSATLSPTPMMAPGTGAGASAEPSVADAVVEAVLLLPGVVRMHAGMFGEVATYLPGRRVHGVRIHDDSAQVHVVVGWDCDIPDTADLIKATVGPIVGTPVDVTVEDLAEPTVDE